MTEQPRHRPIRSFVRREGRFTQAQRAALAELLPVYGLDLERDPDALARLIRQGPPVTMEIGFGNGDALLALAEREPDRQFVGIEVHRPGVGRLLHELKARAIGNVRVACADAIEVLKGQVPDGGLARVLIYFPDPWHKKRHHKRRLVQPPLAALLAHKLASGGLLRLATDWADYAEQMRDVFDAETAFENLAGSEGFVARPEARPLTRFERRGQRLGHRVWDLAYRRR
jgi:tRNA (guanine-N7-)-methyltransferase